MVSEPSFRAQAGIYDFFFEEEQIAIRIDRLHQKGDALTGEIKVVTKQPGEDQLLHQARFNLLSTQSRNTLAKYLITRCDLLDWGGILEIVSILTVSSHREGEPIIQVGNDKIQTERRYRLYPLLLEKEANLIYGPGGSGKSTIASFIGIIVQTNNNSCGMIPIQGNVLYLDYETSSTEINDRVVKIKNGLSLKSDSLDYRFCSQALASEIEYIQRTVLDKGINLVIVDSVGGACGGEPESAEVVLRYFMALRSLKITTLSIDHVTKAGDTKMPFGSVYKANSARSIYELRKSQEAGEGWMDIGLYHRKCNVGRLQKPFGLRIDYFEDDHQPSILFSRSDIREVPGLTEGLTLQDQIAAVLRHGPMTVAEIASELNAQQASVRARLNEHKNRFVKADVLGKKWGLLSKGLDI
ncbi:MAG: hypothetical protein DDT32_02143 [Syntrophomonadaceae bacterium]|nr:hypothetical protein [Bacillota bacterium]MBT9148371.1 hypothetical protein [Bacillota bacterium]